MDLVHGIKLFRLEAALEAVRDELEGLSLDEFAARRLTATVRRLVTEVGSTLPDGLLEELCRVIGPLPAERMSPDEARVLVAQLQGWVEGLLGALRFDVSEGLEVPEPGKNRG